MDNGLASLICMYVLTQYDWVGILPSKWSGSRFFVVVDMLRKTKQKIIFFYFCDTLEMGKT
jgi:hypothetical protein